jgi:hypothetical protein
MCMNGAADTGLFRMFRRRVIKYIAYRRAKKLYDAINRQIAVLESRFVKPLRHA